MQRVVPASPAAPSGPASDVARVRRHGLVLAPEFPDLMEL